MEGDENPYASPASSDRLPKRFEQFRWFTVPNGLLILFLAATGCLICSLLVNALLWKLSLGPLYLARPPEALVAFWVLSACFSGLLYLFAFALLSFVSKERVARWLATLAFSLILLGIGAFALWRLCLYEEIRGVAALAY